MPTINEVNAAITSGQFTNEQLVSIIDAVKFARAQLTKRTVFTVRSGDRVKFSNTRTRTVEVGEVVSVKRKFVHVRTSANLWRVPASMITAA